MLNELKTAIAACIRNISQSDLVCGFVTVISNSDCLHTNGTVILVTAEKDFVPRVSGSRVPLLGDKVAGV
jgi:hypothetical protein